MLRVLIGVGERMIELGIGQTASVMSPRQREKSSFPARELEQRRRHEP